MFSFLNICRLAQFDDFLKIGTKSIGAIVKTGTLANMGAIENISALAKIGAMLKIGASGSAFHLSIPGVEMTPHVIWLKMIKKTDRCISSPFSTLAPLLILSLAVRKCTAV